MTYHSCHVSLNVFLLTHYMSLHVILDMSMLVCHSYNGHTGPLMTEEDCSGSDPDDIFQDHKGP